LKLSVVIPTYNRGQVLPRTLPRIFAQDFPAGDSEVIIVVDGSTDGSVEYLRTLRSACDCRIIEQQNRGQAAARNAGIRIARGDIVLFLDDDILCESNLFSAHMAAHRGNDRTLVFGPVLVAPESPPSVATEMTRRRYEKYYGALASCGSLWPDGIRVVPNTSVSRTVICDAGGFDESLFRAHEDIDLGFRLWEAGVTFRYHPEIISHQLFVKSSDQIVEDERWDGRSEVLLARKHPEYLEHSRLRSYAAGSLAMRVALAAAWFSPISPDLFLRPVSSALEAASPLWPAAVPVVRLRKTLRRMRSAVAEVGSWSRFLREFGTESRGGASLEQSQA
jgi:glycosyltransferase involved in cell wall biosynthesis